MNFEKLKCPVNKGKRQEMREDLPKKNGDENEKKTEFSTKK